jgi:hypothetical protein
MTTVEREPLHPNPPLGLPPGSVRGLLSIMIVALLWLLLLLPRNVTQQVTVPVHVYMLLALVLLFFVAHGRTIARKADPTPSPLYLPGGTLRLIILGGTIATIVYLFLNDRERLIQRLTPAADQMQHWPEFLLALVGGLAVGWIFRFITPLHNWLAVLALFAMLADIVIEVFVYPQLKENADPVVWQCIVTAVVASYFGTRS